MTEPFRIAIVGGGTAGWMCAAACAAKLDPSRYQVRLIESEEIGTVGVGEATLPQIKEFNDFLGIDEAEFMSATQATFKLGIEFVDWGHVGARYIHPFGAFGRPIGVADFFNYWLRMRETAGPLSDYCLAIVAARQNRFDFTAKDPSDPASAFSYAYHLDAGLYARYLRRWSEARGLERIEGRIVSVGRDAESGDVDGVTLASGETIRADLFVDCSGFRGLLIEGALKSGYVDWSHWLPCDRAVAMPCARADGPIAPFTRSTAREAGWQWRIPLQHRTGNGYVYSSRHLGDDHAVELLTSRLDGAPLAEPNRLRFTAGHRRRCWNGNVVALGLAGGFLEPLESTSIHLIQTGIIRLLGLFPRQAIDPAVVERFNADTVHEYERLRDFVLAHYAVSSGLDTPFWRDVRSTALPDSLAARIEAFRTSGNILNEPTELFGPTNWFAILWGQGVRPADHHPIADALPIEELRRRLGLLRQRSAEMLADLPPHEDFLARLGA
jgi:tryptophan halogenase